MKYLISFLLLTLAMVAASAAPSLGTGDWPLAEKEDGAAQDLEEQFQGNEGFKSEMEKKITRMKAQAQIYRDLASMAKRAGNKSSVNSYNKQVAYYDSEAKRFQKLIDSS